MHRIATIGVYGFTADAFVSALKQAGVGVVLAPEYVRRYAAEILDHADLRPAIASWSPTAAP